MVVDLLFPARGSVLHTDHAYALYGALSRIVPAVHEEKSNLRFLPFNGEPAGHGELRLTTGSRLRLRLPEERIREVLPLAGKRLEFDGGFVRLGVPGAVTLRPATRLFSRFVTFKNAMEPTDFLSKTRERLEEMKISGEPQIPVRLIGEHAGEVTRRVMRIKQQAIVGFALLVDELTATDSLKLQTNGLGGRGQMGAGFFLPVKGELL
jgi:CRISPR-associated protein Cas6